ncbi:MAG: hypothetical protein Q7I99_01040, partial [Acholeplasmataceae bacterium]|nr:hypothetical protein [Acholeplasmataceae bacterium]
MKKLLGVIVSLSMLLVLMGCTSLDALSQFERMASREVINTNSLNEIPQNDLDNQDVLTLSEGINLVVGLSSSTLEMTNSDKISYIKELFQSIRETHLENVELAKTTKTSWDELKNNIKIFRDSDFELSSDDKEMLITYRNELKSRRNEVKETFGDIKELFGEL